MWIIRNSPFLLIAVVGILTGGYLILRPREYKDELWKSGDDVISRFPHWAVRVLGAFIILTVVGVSYLYLVSSR